MKLKKKFSKVIALFLALVVMASTAMSNASLMPVMAADTTAASEFNAENYKTATKTYDFQDNSSKAAPTVGGVLDGTANSDGTGGIVYASVESGSGCSYDTNQLRFRNSVTLYLPVANDTTMITYTYLGAGNNAGRPTYIGSTDSGYEVPYNNVEESVTIYDITDMVVEFNGNKYIPIISGGDVKIKYITVTEYNPVNSVTVSGTIDGAVAAGVTSIKFKNLDNAKAEVVTATVDAEGNYSAVLRRVAGNTNYSASISTLGYKLDGASSVFALTGNDAVATANFAVVESPYATIAGTVTGIPDSALKGELAVTLVPSDSLMEPVVVALTKTSDGTYSYENTHMTAGLDYSVVLTNADDYEVLGTINKDAGAHADVAVVATAKPLVAVSGSFVTSDDKASDVTKITYTNMDTPEYSYTFDVTGGTYTANLRAGEYVASVESASYTAYDHVSVGTTAVTNDVYLQGAVDTSAVDYKAEVTVGNGGDFTTIQDAVNYIARMTRSNGERVTIKLLDALYREQVIIDTPNITLNSALESGSTVTWYYGVGYSYYSAKESTDGKNGSYYDEAWAVDKYYKSAISQNPGHWGATVNLFAGAAGFKAENITFENSLNRYMTAEEVVDGVTTNVTASLVDRSTATDADVRMKANKERACVLYIQADDTEYKNCRFISSQDTVYTGDATENSYWVNCFIEGNTDYICGDGNAVFDTCTLSMYGYTDQAATGSYIVASKASGAHGYLFNNCKIVAATDEGLMGTSANILARAWGAGTVKFLNTEVETANMISAAGYADMNSKVVDAHYYEYNTHTPDGTAVDMSGRAEGVTIMTQAEADAVVVSDYFDGWVPAYYDGTIAPAPTPDPKPEVPVAPSAKEYVLDTTADLTAFAQGTKVDGDTEKAGTEDYFTLIYSEKTKIDSSSKEFEDGYTATQRVNFGGAASTEKNAIKFTTSNAATVKVWWVEGGDDNRQITILDAAGTAVATTEVTVAKNAVAISEFELTEAGTYYLGSTPGNNYIFKVLVSETVAATKEYVLDTTADLTAFAQGDKVDGDSQKAGTEDYFTLIYSAKTKVDSSSKEFEDGYTATQRVNFGGAVSTEKNAIKFTTGSAATVKVWWVEGGDDNRQITILDSTGTTVDTTSVTAAKNAVVISEFELAEAGTYYLGSTPNNNYFFKVLVTETVSADPIVSTLDTTADLTAFAQGDKADGDTATAGTNNYFTLIYSAKTKIDSSSKTFEDGYTATQRVNFGGAVSTDKNAIKFTTSNPATVKVWWVEGGDDNRQITILNGSGTAVATTNVTVAKNATAISEFTLAEAGTYYLGSTPGNNYIFKVEVTETPGGAVKPPRADWSTVATPEITNIALNAESSGKIDVTVKANVGYDGADKITVTMMDSTGAVVGTVNSSKEGDGEVTVSLAPTSSGTYTFSVKAIREECEDKVSDVTKTFDFVLPLGKTSIGSTYNKGNGSAAIEWSAVAEAESYVVEYSADGTTWTAADAVTGLSTTISGLTIGNEYSFRVVTKRGTESTTSDVAVLNITEESQVKWGYIVYGNGASSSNSSYSGSVYDGSVQLTSGKLTDGKLTGSGNNGKLVPNSYDGLNFYYTAVDADLNFTLRTKVTVNQWWLSNGQEGFGIMATDQLGGSGWNNSYMAVASKIEYYWDGQDVTTDSTAAKVSQKLGIGIYQKYGVTADNLALLEAGDTATVQNDFKNASYPLEQRYPEATNVVGNGGNIAADNGAPVTEMYLTIQKNNTGYFITYESVDGSYSVTKKYYDTEALEQIDSENVYVGFFTARYAQATFSDITFTTIAPEADAPAEETPVTYIIPSYKIESASVANTSDYQLVYYGNADGTLTVTKADGTIIVDNVHVDAETKYRTDATLALGTNNFVVTFTPDADYVPGKDQALSSYDAVTFNHNVTFKNFNNNLIYVAPNGTSKGNGTSTSPVDIYTAVKYAAPGQKILLAGGTYNLSSTVKVERGINGTADNMIYLMADPDAAERPVFDFGGNCAGMVIGGDYWYLQGFDVTKSAAGQKGLQISGDYNIVDDIHAYRNGNTGIQISRLMSSDLYEDWPAYNLILNCTSYLNADPGYEDADGFAAKLTVGDGNVFDGCIAAYNADDGWDLFAKVETGPIGDVVIKNSIAFKNGYDIDENGNEINAGNGNGFKMGGDSIAGAHQLINSVAFLNKAKGLDSNSGPNIQLYNSTSFNNLSYNVALYTNTAGNTAYVADGVLSMKTSNTETENIKFKGTQVETDVYGVTNYYFDGTKSANSAGAEASLDWFVRYDVENFATLLTRNADGTINMNGLLELTDAAPANVGARMTGTPSADLSTIVDKTVPEHVDMEVVYDTTDNKQVENAIKDLHENDVYTVVMGNNTTEIAGSVFTQAAANKVTLILDCGNYSWKFNGLTEDDNYAINPNVTIGANIPGVNEVLASANVANANILTLSFDHEGKLPGKAEIQVKVSGKYVDGTLVHLYYFDAVKNAFRYVSSANVSSGVASLPINHCSDYIISDTVLPEAITFEQANVGDGLEVDSVETGDRSPVAVLMLMALLAVVCLAYCTIRERRENA